MLSNGHMAGFSDLLICFSFGVCRLQAAATRSLAQGTTLDKVLDMLKQVDILVCLFVFPFFNKVFVAVAIRHIIDQENVNIAVFCADGAQFEGTSGSLYILQPNPEAWSRSFHEGCQGSWCIRYVSPFI
jgi:hypothetical protein